MTDVAPVAAPPLAFPEIVGWTQTCMAVRSVLALNTPVHLRMYIDGHEPLLIDFRHHAYSWSTPIEQFPVDAVHTGLETVPTGPDAPPFFELPGENLDELLWEMGMNSFDGGPAFWLSPDDRFRLTRWPNLNKHNHSLPQVQMIAVLGNGFASATELAGYVGVPVTEAQRLINALSLMRILARSATAAAPVAKAPTAAQKKQSLFARLRARIGR